MRRLIARAWGDLLLPNPACPIRRTESPVGPNGVQRTRRQQENPRMVFMIKPLQCSTLSHALGLEASRRLEDVKALRIRTGHPNE